MAPKFALFTKGSNLTLNKGFKNMFELLQSCAQPSIYTIRESMLLMKIERVTSIHTKYSTTIFAKQYGSFKIYVL